jgi:hypothetical protein
MGWHYTLEVECKVLPEFYEFFQKRYLQEISENNDIYNYNYCEECMKADNYDNCLEQGKCIMEEKYKELSKPYLDIINIWIKYDLGNSFYEYDFNEETGILKFNNTAKVNTRTGYLRDDYMSILYDIIVPTTSEIISCCISSDDYGDECTYYTDIQLRRINFSLSNMIKSIRHKWEDGMIVETTVTYRHSIKKSQELDLDRCYGFTHL